MATNSFWWQADFLRARSFYGLTAMRAAVEYERAHEIVEALLMRVTAETKAATRERILHSAQRLFAVQGYELATTRDIARQAEIAAGTLFNYFPTKEDIALCLISAAHAQAVERFEADLARQSAEPLSLEEELFAHVAAGLRKLKPFRKYLPSILETVLSPLASERAEGSPALRTAHLEIVSRIAARHGQQQSLSTVALHLYWTLYTGVLSFWAQDASPRQEDSLALLDQSLAMFVGWLTTHANPQANLKGGG
jgi:AcrR family transcriptional regulator